MSTSRRSSARKKQNKKMYIVSGILGGILIVALISSAVYFQSHFWPTAEASDIKIGWLNAKGAKDKLDKLNKDNQIVIKMGDQTEEIDLPERYIIDESYLTENIDKKNIVLPVNEAFEDELKEALAAIDFPAGEKSQNAKIDLVDGSYQIVDEVYGTEIDTEALTEKIVADAKSNAETYQYDTKDFYVKPTVLKDDQSLTEKLTALNERVNKKITLKINDEDLQLTPEEIESVLNDKGDVDEDQLYTLIEAIDQKYGTRYQPVTFTNVHGVTKQYSNNGAYGWFIDIKSSVPLVKEALDGKDTEKTVEMVIGGKPSQASKVSGTYAEIDLDAQKMYAYSGGEKIVDTDVITGRYDKRSASFPGLHTIYYMEENATLEGQSVDGSEYSVPVKYWMPLISKGGVITQIGLHDADYKAEHFSNKQAYKTLAGSNGCINTPLSEVAKIYNVAYPGMPVIIYGNIYDDAQGEFNGPVEYGEVVN